MNSIEMIRDLSQAFGPPGFEDDVLAAASKYIPPGYATLRDSLLNFYMQKEEPVAHLPTVMLDAHSDEVGLMVRAVKTDGTIVCTNLGGWTPAALLAQRMLVKSRTGELIIGVMAAKEPASIDQLVLDIGASAKEDVLQLGIAPGCPVVPKSEFEQRGALMFGKAFDDRLGCAVALEVMHELNNQSLDVNLVGTLSSQEEAGLRGASVSANRVKPDVVICLEGAPADDMLGESITQSALDCGPMIRHMDASMITNPRFLRFALDIAQRLGIPVQEAVRTGGGTNGGRFHLANFGIPTLVIACPVRYPHTHNSIASFNDYKHAVQLTVELVKALNQDVIGEF